VRAAKIDANQPEIVEALRSVGCTVQSLATIGKGCPDLLAAKWPHVWVIEVKGPKGTLTADQVEWIKNWHGVVHIVRTVDDALQLVGEA
jgi:Holliday junction resolvase